MTTMTMMIRDTERGSQIEKEKEREGDARFLRSNYFRTRNSLVFIREKAECASAARVRVKLLRRARLGTLMRPFMV